MRVNSIQKKQTNFSDSFQSVLKDANVFGRYPLKPCPACPYADRLMLKTVRKIILSSKNVSKLDISLIDSEKGKSLLFILDPKTVKKFLPKIIQLFRGRGFDLKNPTFWRILNHKKAHQIKYELPQKDLKKMQTYFGTSVMPSERINRTVEDSGIFRISEKIKKSLMTQFEDNVEKQKWISEYFAV